MAWNDNLDTASVAYAIASDASNRIRVVAGPGTGKSFALKRRVAKLLEDGIDPKKILPVTFTRVAAEDLHRELQTLGVAGCDELDGRTLHSLGLFILRKRNVLGALGRVPRPLNKFEIEPLLYDLTNAFGTKIEREKLIRAYEAGWARLQHEEPGFTQTDAERDFQTALLAWLRFHESMLIGEIVPLTYHYLRNNPHAPELNLFDHILVDEFQDLNKAEQGVIGLLAENAHLCIVGDDDQSIYSFKHANPHGIREFHTLHTGTTDHALLDCHRCPTHVVTAAVNLIACNTDRQNRQLAGVNANGIGKMDAIQYATIDTEASGIAEIIAQYIANGTPPGDILVLSQSKVLAKPILERMRERTIPVKSYHEESQLDTEGAQERLATLKLYVNHEDRVALRWLLGNGHTDFRAKAYARIRKYCDDNNMSPWQVMEQLSAGTITIPYTQGLIDAFNKITAEFSVLDTVANNLTGFVELWLPADLDDVSELRLLVEEKINTSLTVEDLLKEVITEVTQPEIPLEVAEVRIMSLHKSKGLSSPIVIIAGCVNGLMPRNYDPAKATGTKAEYDEEQRRLFYVGITRVKAKPSEGKVGTLILTSSRQIDVAAAFQYGIAPASRNGRSANLHASSFISEMGNVVPRARRA